jgi:hypothetical protein
LWPVGAEHCKQDSGGEERSNNGFVYYWFKLVLVLTQCYWVITRFHFYHYYWPQPEHSPPPLTGGQKELCGAVLMHNNQCHNRTTNNNWLELHFHDYGNNRLDSTAVCTHLIAPRPTDAHWYWFYTGGGVNREKSSFNGQKLSAQPPARPVRPHINHGIQDDKGTSIARSRDGCS